jgi:hypothetical protein
MPLSYFGRDADTLDGYDSTDFLKTGSNILTGSQHISGSLYVLDSVHANDFTGSLTQIDIGVPYLLAGPYITITTNSLGQIAITGSAGGESNGAATISSALHSKQIAQITTKAGTTTQVIGQFAWVPADYTGLTSLKIRAIMSTDGTANHTGSLQIYNLTSGSYVDLIDTPSKSKYFTITSSIPSLITSSNLLTGITNFNNSSTSIYEVRVSGSSANNTIIGGIELIFS